MSVVSNIGGFVFGALEQLVNSIAHRVVLPTDLISPVPVGDVLEPRSDARRAGADLVEDLVERLSGVHRNRDADELRDARPRLTEGDVVGQGPGTVTRVTFEADAPSANWGTTGRESGLVAVYVNGRYHSTVVVLHERDGSYVVNLGSLPAGRHHVDLRAATDLAPEANVGLRAGGLRGTTITGEAAQVEAHAPIFELRDTDPGRRHSVGRNDTPMLIVPAVTRHADGSKTIEYRVVFSNEDGGTKTTDLMDKYGRTADGEPMYRVTLDAQGAVTAATYQAPVHRWLPFEGAHAGTRPILRISTANNLTSARTGTPGAERWSEATTGIVGPGVSDFEVMRTNPWTWQVMAKELVREGKTALTQAARGANRIGDPRRYVYLDMLTDVAIAAIRVAGGLEVRLADGRTVLAKVGAKLGTGNRQVAIELPDGATAEAVRGVALIGIRAIVLDTSYAMRELPAAA
ncbi:MAG: hypothetical protein JWM25_751 [Thermoleophilia bacterium]|nr:hypothetical protein [Thermoleophilia bacterium]MCZ4496168.1 hypothetical protein [Thermoleophilia bacterium]